ncbi:hypothetical protein SKAU_G00310440 [Synaphobranchus kaupii]|uniref:Uncharacterized protein n=1 Tax=Synaphobranchus kaupii TaxID=118154 RepID=A0A9Q1ERJ8_SYNKA|nr:hypothetical protein SKAU_G00310440 [Synaphobranchus kaupii]
MERVQYARDVGATGTAMPQAAFLCGNGSCLTVCILNITRCHLMWEWSQPQFQVDNFCYGLFSAPKSSLNTYEKPSSICEKNGNNL